MASSSGDGEIRSIPAYGELRVSVDEGAKAELILTRGKAEIFGTEIALEVPVPLSSGTSVALFTFHGCSVRIKSQGSVHSYIVEGSDTPMTSYAELHMRLQQQREFALSHPSNLTAPSLAAPAAPPLQAGAPAGPRVLVAGPVDHGKPTLGRT